MKKLTVGIVAHVDSGKTTLSEALLYNSGTIRSLGRVDHKNTFLDTFELERKRGITIFSKQAEFSTQNFDITLVDTPRHVDFSAETERVFSILDVAVILISAASGVQSHTETLWSLLRKHNIPTIIFINKMDVPNADKETLMNGIKKKLSANAIPVENIGSCEETAMCSERLMESFLSDGEISDTLIRNSFSDCEIFPCVFGSALKLSGIDDLCQCIDKFAEEKNYCEEFGARIFKVNHDENGSRLTHLKVTGGELCVKSIIEYKDKNGNIYSEKIEQIRIYQGDKFTTVTNAKAGTVCTVTGLTSLLPGDILGFEHHSFTPILSPVLSYRMFLPKEIDTHTALTKLRILETEDPMMKVSYLSLEFLKMWNVS